MFEVTELPERTVLIDQIVQPCRLRLLKVRVVECHLHRGVANLRVTLRRENRDPIEGETDATGYVIFSFAAANLAQAVNLTLTVAMPDSGQYSPKEGQPTLAVAMTDAGGGKAVKLTLRSHWVTPPGDLDTRVKRVLTSSDVRIWVDDGANFGNQASTVDCIKTIRRIDASANFAQEGEHPLVRVLAKSGELAEYKYALDVRVVQPTVNALKALWQRFVALSLPGLEESEDDTQTSYKFDDNNAVTVTLYRVCRKVQLSDNSIRDETSQEHFADVLKALWTTNEARALKLTRAAVAMEGSGPTVVASTAPQVTLKLCYKPDQQAAQVLVSHELTLFVDDDEAVTPQRLRAWHLEVMRRLSPALQAQQDANVAGFTVSEDGKVATITITEARGESHDGVFSEACSQGHACSVIGEAMEHGTATALGLRRVGLRSTDVNTDAFAGEPTLSRRLALVVFSYDAPPPGERLDTLAPRLSDHYARASKVASKDDFDQNARQNIIAIVPAADIGDPTQEISKQQIKGFAEKVGAVDCVVLQPFLWNADRHFIAENDRVLDLCMPKQAAWHYGVPAQLDDNATALLAPQPLQNVFTTLLAKKADQSIRLQVGYGLHQAANAAVTGKNLATALCGLGAPKVVLVVPCKEAAFRGGVAQVARARVVLLDNPQNARQTLLDAIESDQVSMILLTLTAALPGPLFTQLVIRSQLPVLFEGANTAGLLLNARQAHLSVKLGTTSYATKPGLENAVTALGELTDIMNDANATEQNLQRLGAFLDGAAGGGSEVGTYFTDISAHLCHDRLDQLKLALYRLDLERRLASHAEQLPPIQEPQAIDANALVA